ncbi:hypothetical protein AAFF_G00244030 [Aldrovandia affinis]|uniref:Formin GTPase-binding domain-containing protein n=1 Tax=Aldrovandia affinis TaxID=143900 RepID=A0AAD7RDY1_9TELE|nr:hypothetical protein AAFF_G00244030 [Aldrovandia affinis]
MQCVAVCAVSSEPKLPSQWNEMGGNESRQDHQLQEGRHEEGEAADPAPHRLPINQAELPVPQPLFDDRSMNLSEKEIVDLFEKMMEDMNLNEERKAPLRRKDLSTKREMVVQYISATAKSITGSKVATPSEVLMKRKLPFHGAAWFGSPGWGAAILHAVRYGGGRGGGPGSDTTGPARLLLTPSSPAMSAAAIGVRSKDIPFRNSDTDMPFPPLYVKECAPGTAGRRLTRIRAAAAPEADTLHLYHAERFPWREAERRRGGEGRGNGFD